MPVHRAKAPVKKRKCFTPLLQPGDQSSLEEQTGFSPVITEVNS